MLVTYSKLYSMGKIPLSFMDISKSAYDIPTHIHVSRSISRFVGKLFSAHLSLDIMPNWPHMLWSRPKKTNNTAQVILPICNLFTLTLFFSLKNFFHEGVNKNIIITQCQETDIELLQHHTNIIWKYSLYKLVEGTMSKLHQQLY